MISLKKIKPTFDNIITTTNENTAPRTKRKEQRNNNKKVENVKERKASRALEGDRRRGENSRR